MSYEPDTAQEGRDADAENDAYADGQHLWLLDAAGDADVTAWMDELRAQEALDNCALAGHVIVSTDDDPHVVCELCGVVEVVDFHELRSTE